MQAARTDSNQTEIVNALRRMGASVAITSMVGNGFTDIVVGYRGLTVLVEIKDGAKPPSARKLTEAEARFHASWRGAISKIETIDEAIGLLNSMAEHANLLRASY